MNSNSRDNIYDIEKLLSKARGAEVPSEEESVAKQKVIRSRDEFDIELPFDPDTRYMTADELNCWYDIVESAPVGSLTISDKFGLELLARLMCKSRMRQKMSAKEADHLILLMGKFWLTPKDRKVSNPKGLGTAPVENPFDGI